MQGKRALKVQDVMQTQVITVRADTNVQEVARLLTGHRIHSVPVVDEEQRVIGIITESDLFLKEKGIPFSAVRMPALFERWVDPRQLEEIYRTAAGHTAADVMTEEVVCTSPDERIEEAALRMMRSDVRALPVVQDGKLIGILSRKDFVRLLAQAE